MNHDETNLNKLPSEIPVMVLEGFVLFPHQVEALYIFEPRYQAMLAMAHGHDGLMAVVNRRAAPAHKNWDKEDERLLSPVTTLALVRTAVQHDDGTSHIMLQGLERVRIVEWSQVIPFRVAAIEPYPTVFRGVSDRTRDEKARLLVDNILRRFQKHPNVSSVRQAILQHTQDPEVLVDFISANFIADSSKRDALLEMRRHKDRLDFLLEIYA
jgi:Lon protease-like protein